MNIFEEIRNQTMKPTNKVIVYTIQYRVDAKEAVDLSYTLEQLRETGEAEIIDVQVEAGIAPDAEIEVK